MSSNVGLSTPRGSGTSGHVQRNLSSLRPRDTFAPYPTSELKHRQRQPNAEILEHDRLRQIEVQVFDLRDKLEDEGVDEDEIEEQTEALRRKLLNHADGDEAGGKGGGGDRGKRGLKVHQVHELAKAKIEESERLRKALGIRDDYEEGSHWKRGEERLRDGLTAEAKKDDGGARKERY
ncbi:MAG: hypothetical protein LQ350_008147 [Teloschistes chrysophthalmus]|nr:MAG: hypothetical protein LQ350_008147 [Niorma chrysophthalma]